MNALIITYSTDHGLNQKQAMECSNIINSYVTRKRVILDPLLVTEDDVLEADRIVMVIPEWNLSFPWTFKKMIDDSGYPSYFKNKRILLIGTSNTTFGNILGTTQIKTILEWIGAICEVPVLVPGIKNKFKDNNIVLNERLNSSLINFLKTKNV